MRWSSSTSIEQIITIVSNVYFDVIVWWRCRSILDVNTFQGNVTFQVTIDRNGHILSTLCNVAEFVDHACHDLRLDGYHLSQWIARMLLIIVTLGKSIKLRIEIHLFGGHIFILINVRKSSNLHKRENTILLDSGAATACPWDWDWERTMSKPSMRKSWSLFITWLCLYNLNE